MEKEEIGFYQKEIDTVLLELESTAEGLFDDQVEERQKKYGPNKLSEDKKINPFMIFLSQFNSFIIWILIIAVVISFFLGEFVDATIIIIILVLNAVFGFLQEYRAEKVMATLKKLNALKCKVMRKRNIFEIPAEEVVPGDILILSEGEKVPADARIIEEDGLYIDESSLTGESNAVKKTNNLISNKIGIGDQRNMVFASTNVTKGKAKAIVVSIGMKTEIGKIANMINEVKEEETPLQKKLTELGRWLGVLTIIICIGVFAVSIVKDSSGLNEITNKVLLNNFMIAVSLAVAAIPEGLPAIVTISLALGVKSMAKKNVLVRKLPAVETLGSCDVICSDKTGTFTQNSMTVTTIYANKKIIEVSNQKEKDSFFSQNEKYDSKKLERLLLCGVLCNDSTILRDDNQIVGDPTEKSLIVTAQKAGMNALSLKENNKRIKTIPFDSSKKRMTTINHIKGANLVFMKGAPDVIVKFCKYIEIDGKKRKMTKEDIENILYNNSCMAKKALRVLGFAYKEDDKKDPEKDLVFLGLQGMIDPPREGVSEAVRKCHDAGIKVIMITGDYQETAVAIGDEIGVVGKVLTGVELDHMSEESLKHHVEETVIYARVSPEHKLRIVSALQSNGHVVSMTGDGVNDAPALKKADIGVAMGSGTDVAKEASKMIINDDNFVSIVNAVEEGRKIYDNIKKFVIYLVSFNIAEVLLIFLSVMLGLPLPLIAIQILWLNLVTDGLPALALGVDPASEKIMNKKPRNKSEKFVNKYSFAKFAVIGTLAALATLYIYILMIKSTNNLNVAQTGAFTALVIFEIAGIQMIRSEYQLGFFSNKALILAAIGSILLQLSVIYTPVAKYFKTVPLGVMEWLIISTAAILVISLYYIMDHYIKKYLLKEPHR